MLTTRKQDQNAGKLPTFEQTEPAVKRGVDRDGQGLLAIAMLIFALALCALVFQSGWRKSRRRTAGADALVPGGGRRHQRREVTTSTVLPDLAPEACGER